MTDVNYWSKYYKDKTPDEIPWNNYGDKLLNFLFKKYDLPKKGNVLDVGTGTGKKAIALKEKGYDVWAFDVANEAFSEAAKNNPEIHFFVSDAIELGSSEIIQDINFDIVFDLLVTQFLSEEEKQKYLAQLSDHLKKDSYYTLQTFYKDKGISSSKIPWINKASQSKEDIQSIYGKHFDIIDLTTKNGKKGADVVVVMKKK